MKLDIIKPFLTTISFIVLADLQITNIYILLIYIVLAYFYLKIKSKNNKYVNIFSFICGMCAVLLLFSKENIYKSINLLLILKAIIVYFGTYYFIKGSVVYLLLGKEIND